MMISTTSSIYNYVILVKKIRTQRLRWLSHLAQTKRPNENETDMTSGGTFATSLRMSVNLRHSQLLRMSEMTMDIRTVAKVRNDFGHSQPLRMSEMVLDFRNRCECPRWYWTFAIVANVRDNIGLSQPLRICFPSIGTGNSQT